MISETGAGFMIKAGHAPIVILLAVLWPGVVDAESGTEIAPAPCQTVADQGESVLKALPDRTLERNFRNRAGREASQCAGAAVARPRWRLSRRQRRQLGSDRHLQPSGQWRATAASDAQQSLFGE